MAISLKVRRFIPLLPSDFVRAYHVYDALQRVVIVYRDGTTKMASVAAYPGWAEGFNHPDGPRSPSNRPLLEVLEGADL